MASFNLLTHLYEISERLSIKISCSQSFTDYVCSWLGKGKMEVCGCVSVENVILGERQQDIYVCQSRNG